MDTKKMMFDIENQVECCKATTKSKQNIYKLLIIVFSCTIMSLIMMKRPLFCESGDYIIMSYKDKHMSQHMFDPYSITHALHGLIMFRMFSHFVKRDINLLLTIIISCVWEIIENTPTIINMYRQDAINAGYYGDSIINSISDILFCTIGWVISMNIDIFWSILIYILSECICMIWIGDNLIRNIFILSNTIDISILLLSGTWVVKLLIEGIIMGYGTILIKKIN